MKVYSNCMRAGKKLIAISWWTTVCSHSDRLTHEPPLVVCEVVLRCCLCSMLGCCMSMCLGNNIIFTGWYISISGLESSDQEEKEDQSSRSATTSAGYSTLTKKKPKWCSQSFNQEWLKNPELKDWLQMHPDKKHSASCKVCVVKFKNSDKYTLLAHKNNIKKL